MATTKKPAVKKSAAKPAARKTTTVAKTATSTKKTAAKPAAKSVAKKTTTVKTTVELSVTGNKKVETLMKEFTKKFPYLRLRIYSGEAKKVSGSLTPYRVDISKTLASVRDKSAKGGDISISGNKKIKTLEKEFDTVFGLYVQVCYTAKDGHRYYTSGTADEMTLAAFNRKCEADGCKKDEWK